MRSGPNGASQPRNACPPSSARSSAQPQPRECAETARNGQAANVGGHGILNAGGQKTECWRPRKLNGRGQETCSLASPSLRRRRLRLGSLRVSTANAVAEERVSEDDRGNHGDSGSLRSDAELSRRGRAGRLRAEHGGALCVGAPCWRAENDACTAQSVDGPVPRQDRGVGRC